MTSGWCSAPAGARPACERCRWDVCTCTCHVPEPPRNKGSEHFGGVNWGVHKAAPGGASTPESQGLADWIGVD